MIEVTSFSTNRTQSNMAWNMATVACCVSHSLCQQSQQTMRFILSAALCVIKIHSDEMNLYLDLWIRCQLLIGEWKSCISILIDRVHCKQQHKVGKSCSLFLHNIPPQYGYCSTAALRLVIRIFIYRFNELLNQQEQKACAVECNCLSNKLLRNFQENISYWNKF
jgi:hypothetical protein